MGFIAWLIGCFRTSSIDEISVPLPPHELKKRVKVLVIDDEEDSFPTKGLQDDGYTIEWWPSVDSPRLRRLETGDFDIVVLDIQGVVEPTLSDTGDGRGIVRRLKRVNPSQVVIAFSGKTYDLDAVPFFRQTDDTLRKPVSLIQCKEVLDRLIQEHVSVRGYWQNLRHLLEQDGVSERRIRRLEDLVVRSALDARRLSLDDVRNIIGTIDSIQTVVSWANKIISLCTT